MPIWWPSPREPQWMLTTTSSTAQAECVRGRRVEDLRHALHLEVVVARAERAHLVALPVLRRVGHLRGIGAGHRAVLLDARQVVRAAVALLDRPARAARQHRVHPGGVEPQRAGAAEARRDAREQRVGEPDFTASTSVGGQAGVQRAHAAGDVEAHAAGRHDAAVVRHRTRPRRRSGNRSPSARRASRTTPSRCPAASRRWRPARETFSSMPRISASSAKITPGTRIAPARGICHSHSAMRISLPGSMRTLP